MEKKLSEMSLEELWKLFPIYLTEHQPYWKEWYTDEESFLKYEGMECVECGCCSFVCPAKRHLTQSIKSMRKMILEKRKK